VFRLTAPLLLSLLLFGTCANGPGAEPSGRLADDPRQEQAGPAAPADTLVARDGGEVRLGQPLRERLLAQDTLWARALRVHYDAIVMDGHVDTPTLKLDHGYDFGRRNPTRNATGHVDLPKMIEGGLDAPFFAIYVARNYGEGQAATDRALAMIRELKRQVAALDGIEMAYSAADVLRLTRSGRKAALMGLEGGHALQGSVEVLRQLHAEGIRYVGVTHTNTNSWADSSQDRPRHGGLNDLGRQLVREMNRLGVLVDLSHASDEAFYDAVEVSRAPIILSHSSMRALVDTPRNVTDDMLRALAANGGVIMVNFFDPTVNGYLTHEVMDAVHRRVREHYGGNQRMVWQATAEERAARGLGKATVSDVVDHIEHAIRVAGIDHVGLGSDFDGVFSLPTGLEDATRLPFITYELLRRGYSEGDVRKVLGGNTLRVIAEAEAVARELQAEAAEAVAAP
jgi:membrane dipeptidase